MRNEPRVVLPVAVVMALLLAWAVPAMAASHSNHGNDTAKSAASTCELCAKPIAAKSQVTLTRASDHSQHRYACAHCALLAARDWVKGDVSIVARSAGGGAKVEWTRRNGTWQVSPASAMMLAISEANGDCQQEHLVFKDEAEFRAYGKTHRAANGHTLIPAAQVGRIIDAGRGPLLKEATCPVTGNTVHPTAKTEWTVYQGKSYYFCCVGCKPKFGSDPDGFISGRTPKRPGKMKSDGGCGGMTHGDKGSGGGCSGQQGGGDCGGHAKPDARKP